MPAVYIYNANSYSCSKGLCGQFQGSTSVVNAYPLQIGAFYISPYSNNVFQITSLSKRTILGESDIFVDNTIVFGDCIKACNYIGNPPTQPSLSPTPTKSISKTPSVTPSITKTPSVTPTVTPSVSVSSSPNFTPSVTPSNTPSTTPSKTPSVTPTPSPSLGMTFTVTYEISSSAPYLSIPTSSRFLGTYINGTTSEIYSAFNIVYKSTPSNTRLTLFPSTAISGGMSETFSYGVTSSSPLFPAKGTVFVINNPGSTGSINCKVYKNNILIKNSNIVGSCNVLANSTVSQSIEFLGNMIWSGSMISPNNPYGSGLGSGSISNGDAIKISFKPVEYFPVTYYAISDANTTAKFNIYYSFDGTYYYKDISTSTNPNIPYANGNYSISTSSYQQIPVNAVISSSVSEYSDLYIYLTNTSGQKIRFGVGSGSGNFSTYCTSSYSFNSATGSNIYLNVDVNNGNFVTC